MEVHELEGVLDRAHRSSIQLMTVAGLVAGLLLGIGVLGIQGGNLRFAIGIWAVALAVTLGLLVAARQLRTSAMAVVNVGLVAIDARGKSEAAQAALTQRIGELQTQVVTLQSDVDRYVRTPPTSTAPTGTPASSDDASSSDSGGGPTGLHGPGGATGTLAPTAAMPLRGPTV